MGSFGIILVIDDGVYVCICIVYSSVFKYFTQQAFVYYSHFSTKEKSECCGATIDNISYAPIHVMEVKDTRATVHWRICLGNSLMAIALSSLHSELLQMILHNIQWIFIDYYTGIWLNFWNIEDGNIQIQKFTGKLLDMTLFQNNSTNLQRNFLW